MSDTLIKLLKNIVKENRLITFKENKEDNKLSKLELIKSIVNKEFKKGITSDIYLTYLSYYIDDKVLFDMDDNDYLVINVGKNILKGMLNRLVYFNVNFKIYEIDEIDNKYLGLITSIYECNDIIMCLEYSDNEGRIILANKYNKNRHRRSTKILNDFAFYNLIINKDEEY